MKHGSKNGTHQEILHQAVACCGRITFPIGAPALTECRFTVIRLADGGKESPPWELSWVKRASCHNAKFLLGRERWYLCTLLE